ncbi:unnamed protein product [Lactuca saligna]|uniref:Uncharacterized protein n=1 Tax=Lactuca saligna TaxID=75948 RepID=A0AA35VN77_LACSI|nr:unnamed protein product [Lactuca saligna]
MTTSPSPHFSFGNPTYKYEDEESLALTIRLGQCQDIDRWHSRREFLKSYQFSYARLSLKEKMKKGARKIGIRVYKLTLAWPSVFILRCYVPIPCIEEVHDTRQDQMHDDHYVFLEHVSQGFMHPKSLGVS